MTSTRKSNAAGPGPTVVPSEYRVLPTGYTENDLDTRLELRVAWRGGELESGADRWAVVDCRGRCLAADGTWMYEPRPSSRDEGFRDRFRFSRDEALRLAAETVDSMTFNGRTLAQWIQRGASDH